MGGNTELSGPDLGEGIDAAVVEAGREDSRPRQRRGRAPARVGDDVLRRRRDVHALRRPARRGRRSSATRCAARGTTPASACAPARRCARPRSSPIACWRVERRGDRVVVTREGGARAARADLPAATSTADPRASSSSARARRGTPPPRCCAAAGYDGPRHDDRRRCRRAVRPAEPLEGLSRRQRARGVDPAPAAGVLRRASHRDRARPRVDAIDTPRTTRRRSRAATRSRYDALLLATGAEPVHLDMPGRRICRTCTTCARSPTAARSSRAAKRRSAPW